MTQNLAMTYYSSQRTTPVVLTGRAFARACGRAGWSPGLGFRRGHKPAVL